MIVSLLWLLATLDSAFIGYREAAGRNALIEKKTYYRHALIRGALFGQLAVLMAGVVAAIVLASSNNAWELFGKLERIGARMLLVYIPYALIILITLSIRALPSVDIRSITSTVIFGPFTLIRPLVVLLGAVWGILAAPGPITVALVVLIVCLMLGLEWTLGRLRSRGLIS
jgi:L-asparagine transporter-like permease